MPCTCSDPRVKYPSHRVRRRMDISDPKAYEWTATKIVRPLFPRRRKALKKAIPDCSGIEPARSVIESTTMNSALRDNFSITRVMLLRIGPASSPSVGSGIGYMPSLFVLIDWLTSRLMEAIWVAKPSGLSSDVKYATP